MESLITLMEIEQSMPFQDSALWELIKNYYIHVRNDIASLGTKFGQEMLCHVT